MFEIFLQFFDPSETTFSKDLGGGCGHVGAAIEEEGADDDFVGRGWVAVAVANAFLALVDVRGACAAIVGVDRLALSLERMFSMVVRGYDVREELGELGHGRNTYHKHRDRCTS